jgi:formyltetrahydrofolate deformylase
MEKQQTAVLLIHCPDARGIVADVTGFIRDHNGNVLHLDQHVDFEQNVFFMRMVWSLDGFNLSREDFITAFASIASRYRMAWTLHYGATRLRMALFVSKLSHCLYDILSRHEAGEYEADIPLIISNHEALRNVADRFGIPFHVFPITAQTKADQEQREIALLKDERVDTVVLARYMQILSADFVAQFPNQIINIHHSFLPAFAGARPYHAAYARGVKIIGATSHYVTSDLDQGPIIEQDIIRVTHKETIEDFVRKGRDLEKTVLSRAIWLHARRQILVYNNKTVILG